MPFVDGFVASVPDDKRADFIAHAKAAGKVFKANGALRVVENWGDDVPDGKLTSFPMAVKCEKGETVVFSWIEWPSKEIRDKGMEAAMADPTFQEEGLAMPFDGKRMIFGGFETVLDL